MNTLGLRRGRMVFAVSLWLLGAYSVLGAVPARAHAAQVTPSPSPAFLQKFKENPRWAMDLLPEKSGAVVSTQRLREKVRACRRGEMRQLIMSHSSMARSFHIRSHSFAKENRSSMRGHFLGLNVAASPRFEASKFLESEEVVDRIEDGEILRQAQTEIRPWSGYYWPFSSGVAAKRYMDTDSPSVGDDVDWKVAYEYYVKNSPRRIAKKLMAPSEKYDFFAGDEKFTLTEANWRAGRAYYDVDGKVESWMGICHGWAAASYMEPRPSHTVRVKSLTSGQGVEFLPDDVKALVSLRWAYGAVVDKDTGAPATRFAGGRCDEKNPKKDVETGRIIDPECFDLNPAVWHLIITNRVGREHRPFIMDATYDYEVWNHPVTSYTFRYFNPKTLEDGDDLAAARVRLDDPSFEDKFKKYRGNKAAVEIVGIIMRVKYVIESYPEGIAEDTEENDLIRTTTYHYDLELDDQGRIVGGEWYQNRHPDFVWTPTQNAVASSRWDLTVRSSADAIKEAEASSQALVPLRYLVERLLGGYESFAREAFFSR